RLRRGVDQNQLAVTAPMGRAVGHHPRNLDEQLDIAAVLFRNEDARLTVVGGILSRYRPSRQREEHRKSQGSDGCLHVTLPWNWVGREPPLALAGVSYRTAGCRRRRGGQLFLRGR